MSQAFRLVLPGKAISKGIFGASGSWGVRRFISSTTMKPRVSIKDYALVNKSWKGARSSNMTMLFGAACSVVGLSTINHNLRSPILNDVTFDRSFQSTPRTAKKAKNEVKGAFGGRLNYQELSIGSITGLFLGIIAGKLSSVIVILSLSGYFLTQFLESRGMISIPWRKVITVGSESIELKKLIFEQPCFKISFALSFLIAAYNI